MSAVGAQEFEMVSDTVGAFWDPIVAAALIFD